MSYITLSIVGLSLDLVGVILLFKYVILPNNLREHILMDSGMSDKDEKKHKIWSKIALGVLILGFSFQLTSSIMQSKPESNIAKIENMNLGNDVNLTTGISGDLKLKFEQNILFYQLSMKSKNKIIDGLDNFTIQLLDKEGFKISEIIIENSSNNLDATNLVKQDSVFISVKSKVSFTSKKYSQIESWELLTKKR